MPVIKLMGRLQDYFQFMVGKTIEAVAVFDGELVLFLDDKSEVCIMFDGNGLALQINEQVLPDD